MNRGSDRVWSFPNCSFKASRRKKKKKKWNEPRCSSENSPPIAWDFYDLSTTYVTSRDVWFGWFFIDGLKSLEEYIVAPQPMLRRIIFSIGSFLLGRKYNNFSFFHFLIFLLLVFSLQNDYITLCVRVGHSDQCFCSPFLALGLRRTLGLSSPAKRRFSL
jgi:hypothetical protein